MARRRRAGTAGAPPGNADAVTAGLVARRLHAGCARRAVSALRDQRQPRRANPGHRQSGHRCAPAGGADVGNMTVVKDGRLELPLNPSHGQWPPGLPPPGPQTERTRYRKAATHGGTVRYRTRRVPLPDQQPEMKSPSLPGTVVHRGEGLHGVVVLAESKGFEPLMQVLPTYSLSRGAPSATRSRLRRRARILARLHRARAGAEIRRLWPMPQPRSRRPVRGRRPCAARARPAPCTSRRSPRWS